MNRTLHQTVLWNKADYAGFPEPDEEWTYQDVDVPRSAFQKASCHGWIIQVGSTGTENSRGKKLWQTSEDLWEFIERYCE